MNMESSEVKKTNDLEKNANVQMCKSMCWIFDNQKEYLLGKNGLYFSVQTMFSPRVPQTRGKTILFSLIILEFLILWELLLVNHI